MKCAVAKEVARILDIFFVDEDLKSLTFLPKYSLVIVTPLWLSTI